MDGGDMLDAWVLTQRERAFMEQSLDHVGVQKYAKEDILNRIYIEIEQEAAGLRDNGKYDYRLLFRYRLKNMRWKAAAAAKEADRRLQKVSFYKRHIRTYLKMLYGWKTAGSNVNAVLLMAHRKETYVRLLYRKVLNREPDEEGFSHNLTLLREKKVDKVELLNAFCASREGGRYRKVTGRRMAGMIYGRRKKEAEG
ncbi:MAG: DUF4214 domain-containing protein [Eubacterium sp.]|nr:DUF4214 domain-containing protein [Eubacterium sp.]